MTLDFSKLGSTNSKKPSINPIDIFDSLPSLEGTPNDLWRGQSEALSTWHENRDKKDVLISLNTGSGKTIVGLIIAQSLVNEEIENVIYVCSTIDLVKQTSEEADRIGIRHTIRIHGTYSNELFEIGKSFCITTYSALFNGISSIRKKYFPGAIIFDDAHVAESLLRNAFTIRVSIQDRKDLFEEIKELFAPHFKDLGISSHFNESICPDQHSTAFVAPNGLYERSERLLNIFEKYRLNNDSELKYPFAWLKDNLDDCAALFTRGVFEISPPFLPSLALDIFEQSVRRVYLSATLQSKTDFIRAFGRRPTVTIEPKNDAGNGERLIINCREIKGQSGQEVVKDLISKRKAIIAVSDYFTAEKWKDLAIPPNVDDFSDELSKFRSAKDGAFVLVSRVDGIDLPHDTCRIMVIDGLPSGTSLLERYQWEFLHMKNVHAVRVANRLSQLFGRINRGRNDYGAFLLEGNDINKWMNNDRNLSLLPPLLQKQVHVGRVVQRGLEIKSKDKLIEVVDSVINRNESWLDYYNSEVKGGELDKDQVNRAKEAEPFLEKAALSEAAYAASVWSRDFASARREFEKTVDETATHDTPLGGWHALWLGAVCEREGDSEAARREYMKAMRRLGRAMILPRGSVSKTENDQTSLNEFGKSLWSLLGHQDGSKFEKEFSKLKKSMSLIGTGSPNEAEAHVRVLGELLGFISTRPDNDNGRGPDVLWCDDTKSRMLGFELKTDKIGPGTYSKRDIGQGYNHIAWMKKTHPAHESYGLLYVGPDGASADKATPSQDMGLCLTDSMISLRDEIIALIEDIRKKTPMERFITVKKETDEEKWSMSKIFDRLNDKKL